MSKFINIFSKALLILLTFTLVGSVSQTNTRAALGVQYYIDSSSGNDANNGLSPQKPWKSLSKVQSEENGGKFKPGDTISFKAGTSYNGSLSVLHSGVAGSPIKITSYGAGAKPIFTSPNASDVEHEVFFLVGDYLIIENLDVRGGRIQASGPNGVITDTAVGVQLYQSDNSVVRNMEISGTGFAINIDGENNLIENNYIHDCELIENSSHEEYNDYGGVGVLIMGDNNRMVGNKVESNDPWSHDFGPAGLAFQFFAGVDEEVSGNIIEKNSSINNGGLLELSGREGSSFNNNTISYNFLRENGHLFTFNVFTGIDATLVKNLNYFNNTAIELNRTIRAPYIVSTTNDVNSDMFVLKNNIFYLKNFSKLSEITNFEHSNNLYYLEDTELGFKKNSSEIISNPFFTDFANGDYTLSKQSPAIDMGLNLGLKSDFKNTSVPQGNAPDLGAFEYKSANQNGAPALYRFWSLEKKGHFYTPNVGERNHVLSTDQTWTYEGIAYYVETYNPSTQKCADTSMVKIHRFWSQNYEHHFYTKSEAEKNKLIAEDPNWVYEGVTFCAANTQVGGRKPVHRFWSANYRGHFFTMNEAEKNRLIAEDPNWAYEGVAYYARE